MFVYYLGLTCEQRGDSVETIPSWNYWWGLLQPFSHQKDTNQKVIQCNWLFNYLLNSETHFVKAHYSLVGIDISVYVRRCACPLLMGLLSFDLLWEFLTLVHIMLDLLDLSSTKCVSFLV